MRGNGEVLQVLNALRFLISGRLLHVRCVLKSSILSSGHLRPPAPGLFRVRLVDFRVDFGVDHWDSSPFKNGGGGYVRKSALPFGISSTPP